MKKLSVVGLDLAKNVFQVHGIDAEGEVVVRKQLRRSEMRKYFARLEPCLIGMEACGGAHYWSRELTRLGHTVRMKACLRPRERFWDIPVPKIDSAFDNLLVPQPSWSLSATQQLRKLVAAPHSAPI